MGIDVEHALKTIYKIKWDLNNNLMKQYYSYRILSDNDDEVKITFKDDELHLLDDYLYNENEKAPEESFDEHELTQKLR